MFLKGMKFAAGFLLVWVALVLVLTLVPFLTIH